MLLWKPASKAATGSLELLANGAVLRNAAAEHLKGDVALRLAELQAHAAANRLTETEDYLRRAYDYQESELASARRRYSEKAKTGERQAAIELERIKQQQRSLSERRDRAFGEARREVELPAGSS